MLINFFVSKGLVWNPLQDCTKHFLLTIQQQKSQQQAIGGILKFHRKGMAPQDLVNSATVEIDEGY